MFNSGIQIYDSIKFTLKWTIYLVKLIVSPLFSKIKIEKQYKGNNFNTV